MQQDNENIPFLETEKYVMLEVHVLKALVERCDIISSRP